MTALHERARDRSAQGPGFSLGGPEEIRTIMISQLEATCKEKNINYSANHVLKNCDLRNIVSDFFKKRNR